MPRRTTARLLALFVTLALPVAARADWDEGRVPEGDTAFTMPRKDVRVSLLGRSSVGITNRLELSTYIPLDLSLLFNLALKWRFHDGEQWATSANLTVAAGGFPVAAGGMFLPFVFGGAAALVGGSYQSLVFTESYRPSPHLALSLTGGAFAVEIATVGAGAAVGPGAAAAVPFVGAGADWGVRAGVQLDVPVGEHDLFSLSTDLWWRFDGRAGGVAGLGAAATDGAGAAGATSGSTGIDGGDGFAIAMLTWTHAWRHFHTQLGAYAMTDIPHFTTLRNSQMPVGPYGNLYWTF